ncbi:MAG TPA: hypothetical protein VHY20_01145, partial [Pirellulales bacterium]|nr:hypothetical protein [Pirellulales bacterium]
MRLPTFLNALVLFAVLFGPVSLRRAQERGANVAAEEKAAAAAAPAEAAPASPIPEYFAGANPKKWPDPTGANAGYWTTPSDTPGDGDPSKLGSADLYDRIAHNLFSINMVWTLVAGFLVMFMQAGFSMVEAGLCRAKNAAHTMAMNFMIYPLGCIAFWAYGFALGWGNWFNAPVAPGWYSPLGPGTAVLNQGFALADGAYQLFGTTGFFLHGMDDVSVMALFFF